MPEREDKLVEEVARAICRVNTEQRVRALRSEEERRDAVQCQVENGWDLWQPEARAILPIIQAAEAAAYERAAKVAEDHSKARREAMDNAKARKARQEARDHESMAIEGVHIATAIRQLGAGEA